MVGSAAAVAFGISIHALHEESDGLVRHSGHKLWTEFQSTLSMRRATIISIHALRIEPFQSTLSMRRATIQSSALRCMKEYFNPRSP